MRSGEDKLTGFNAWLGKSALVFVPQPLPLHPPNDKSSVAAAVWGKRVTNQNPLFAN